MTDKQRHLNNLLTGSAFRLINFVLIMIIGLVLAPYIYDVLGQRHYGINNIAAGLIGAFSLVNFGMAGAASRYITVAYAKGQKEECIHLGNTVFFLYSLCGLLGTVGIIITALSIYCIYPAMEDRFLFLIVLVINAFSFGISLPRQALDEIVNGTLRSELTGIRLLIFRIISVIATVLVLILGGRLISLAFIALMITIANAIVSFRLVYIAFPDFVLQISSFKKALLKKLFSYGSFTFLVFLSNILKDKGSIFLISTMISIETNALYGLIVLGLAERFFYLTEIMLGGWLAPWITLLHENQEKTLLEKTLRFIRKISVCIVTFITFGLIVWGPDFLLRWGGKRGEEFLSVYPALALLTISVWISQCQVSNVRYLFATAQHAFVGYASLIGHTVGLILAAVSIILGFGINGVAFSVLLANIGIHGIAIPIYFLRFVRNESIIMYYLNMSYYVMLAGLSCLIPYIIFYTLSAPSYPRLFLVGILSAVTYFPIFFLLALDKVEKEKIISVVTTRFKRRRKSKDR